MKKMYNTTIAHIVYASDNKFTEILGVSLVSLYDNSKDLKDIKVYILDSGITQENKLKLQSIAISYNRSELYFISARNINKVLSINVKTDRGSLSQYARLFVSRDLPEQLERVLYLDCDIIVNKSLSELWQLDMQGKTIAALKDAFSRQYRKNIELHERDIMFNSGVMLIDLIRWKEQKIEQKLLKFIKKYNGDIQQGDQGALNAVLSKDICCFHPKFNSVTIFYDFTYSELITYRKPVDFYSLEEITEAVKNPVIIHYTTSFLNVRPWVQGCNHFYKDKWIKYKSMSPWADCMLWPNNKTKSLKGIFFQILSKLPRKLCIALSGFLQAYGRPFVYSLKNKLLHGDINEN